MMKTIACSRPGRGSGRLRYGLDERAAKKRPVAAVSCQDQDLNLRPSGYEPEDHRLPPTVGEPASTRHRHVLRTRPNLELEQR